MKIAVLGWGSLIWNPENLKIKKAWQNDGPLLPIEFARISNDGRLTLVIKKNEKKVQTLWSIMDFDNIEQARLNLKERENTISINSIGFVDTIEKNELSRFKDLSITINKWALEKNIDAVIWTDLRVKFFDKIHKPFNDANAVKYLKDLPIKRQKLAKEYILKAPVQIDTRLRKKLIENLVS